MENETYSALRSAIKTYIDKWTSGKKLKKHLLSASPQTRYDLLLSTKTDGTSALHMAAALKETFHHCDMLRCMLDGMIPVEKYTLLEQQNSPYGNNPLHLLVIKDSPEIANMVNYLLNGLDIHQRQNLIQAKNAAGDTVISRAYRHRASAAVQSILQASVAGVPATAPPEIVLHQSHNVNVVIHRTSPQSNEGMPYGAEAPPSYTDVMLDQPRSQETDDSLKNGAAKSAEATESIAQGMLDLESRCNELQDRCEQLEKEKFLQYQDLTAKLRAAEEKLAKMNLGVDG